MAGGRTAMGRGALRFSFGEVLGLGVWEPVSGGFSPCLRELCTPGLGLPLGLSAVVPPELLLTLMVTTPSSSQARAEPAGARPLAMRCFGVELVDPWPWASPSCSTSRKSTWHWDGIRLSKIPSQPPKMRLGWHQAVRNPLPTPQNEIGMASDNQKSLPYPPKWDWDGIRQSFLSPPPPKIALGWHQT